MFTGPGRYTYVKTEMSGPMLVGFFSVNEDQELLNDTSQLKYVVGKAGKTHIDLKLNFDYTKYNSDQDKSPFFRYLLSHKQLLNDVEGSTFADVGFVTSRKTLMYISQMPHLQNPIILNTRLVNGAIYVYRIVLYDTTTPYTNLSTPWGYKFRQYMFSENATNDVSMDKPYLVGEEFVGVFKMLLNTHKILYRCEINVMQSDKAIPISSDEMGVLPELDQKEFVSLKIVTGPYNETSFRINKSRSAAIHAIFGNVSQVFFGLKDDNGVVSEVIKHSTSDLQNMGAPYWKVGEMITFCEEAFTYIKRCFSAEITRNGNNINDIKTLPEMVMHFKKTPKQNLELVEFSEDVNDWVPKWYSDQL
ncbi:decapping and exoribonuclease protein Rai1-like isoform X2 [Arctopsyche grandis]